MSDRKFEGTIVLPGAGAEPEVAAAVVEHVVRWARDRLADDARKLAVNSMELSRSSIVIKGELGEGVAQKDVLSIMGVLGGDLKATAARARKAIATRTPSLPRSAEDRS